MPGVVGDILVWYQKFRPAEPAKVPDHLHQTVFKANTEVVVHCWVVADPKYHSVCLVSEYLHLNLSCVTENLFVIY